MKIGYPPLHQVDIRNSYHFAEQQTSKIHLLFTNLAYIVYLEIRTLYRTCATGLSLGYSTTELQTLVTDHHRSSAPSMVERWAVLSIFFSPQSTFTDPFLNTCPSHSSRQLSGEWQNITLPVWFWNSVLIPFSGLPPCDPKITEPGRGDSKVASRCASCNCCPSLKRWNNAVAWMAETCPWRGVREVKELRGGQRFPGFSWRGSAGAIIALSNASPCTKTAGKDWEFELNSSCPKFQNSTVKVFTLQRIDVSVLPHTLLKVERYYVLNRPPIGDDLSYVVANYILFQRKVDGDVTCGCNSQQHPMSRRMAPSCFASSRTFW